MVARSEPAAAAAEGAAVTAGRRFVFSRTFDAPRALVFRAWTDP